jgi:hypothetical protein
VSSEALRDSQCWPHWAKVAADCDSPEQARAGVGPVGRRRGGAELAVATIKRRLDGAELVRLFKWFGGGSKIVGAAVRGARRTVAN